MKTEIGYSSGQRSWGRKRIFRRNEKGNRIIEVKAYGTQWSWRKKLGLRCPYDSIILFPAHNLHTCHIPLPKYGYLGPP